MGSIRSLTGVVALITGGASGLGLATAKRLVNHGAKVVIGDLHTSKGQEKATEIGENAIFSPMDVTQEDDVKKSLDLIESNFKKLDIVVNCAAIGVAFQLYNFNKNTAHKLEDFEKVTKVNTTGTFNVIRLAVGLMGKNKADEDGERGVIINTTSYPAFEGQSGQVAYSASQGGIAAMTLPLARDLAEKGIRCCSISTGLFRTPLLEHLPPEVIKFLEDTIPCPSRLGHADEFAHLVQFIIENRMINGETIRIDGAMRGPPLN